MSMLGEQIKELREMADAMHRRSREIGLDYGMGRGLADASRMLREAADTIESLRDRLQGCECDVVKSYGKHPVTNNDVVLYNCSKCGKWIGLSANYCGNCGARIRKTVDA